jgi:hypothetical protein
LNAVNHLSLRIDGTAISRRTPIVIRNCILLAGLTIFFLFARNIMGDIPLLVNFKSGALVFFGTIVGGLLAFPVHTLRGFLTSLSGSLKPQPKNRRRSGQTDCCPGATEAGRRPQGDEPENQ